MARKRKKKERSCGIGGQAVIEGIMMKNKERYAVAVRTQENEIEVAVEEYHSFAPSKKLTEIPFVRGIFNFVDSLILGTRTLTYSATFYEEVDEKESGKEKEKLLEYSSGKNLKQITKELINAFDPDEIEKLKESLELLSKDKKSIAIVSTLEKKEIDNAVSIIETVMHAKGINVKVLKDYNIKQISECDVAIVCEKLDVSVLEKCVNEFETLKTYKLDVLGVVYA